MWTTTMPTKRDACMQFHLRFSPSTIIVKKRLINLTLVILAIVLLSNAELLAQPAIPVANDVSRCGPGSVTLTATCATPGAVIIWLHDNVAFASGPTYTTANLSSTANFTVGSVLAGVPSQGTDPVAAIIYNNVASADAGSDQSICLGQSIGIGSSPSIGFTYSWSPATGLSSSTISNPVASPSSTTTYTLTVTSCSGATATDQVIVTVKPLPPVPVGSDVSRCGPGSVTLRVSSEGQGGVSLFWFQDGSGRGTGLSYTTPELTSNSTYTVGALLNGCAATSTTDITAIINQLPDAPQLGADIGIEEGQGISIGVDPVPGFSYSWSPTEGLSASDISKPVASPSETTTYNLTVTDQNGCSATSPKTVTVSAGDEGTPMPEIIATYYPTYIRLSYAEPPPLSVFYFWQTSSTGTSTANGYPYWDVPLCPGTYYLRAVGTVGVTGWSIFYSSITLDEGASAGPDLAICAGDKVPIGDDPAPGYSYSWSASPSSSLGSLSATNISNPTAHPTVTTTYTLATTSSCGTFSDDVTITIISEPVLTTFSPTASENHIMITTMNIPGSIAVNPEDANRTITYFDGLGKTKQTIAAGNSPQGMDIIQPVLYDNFGRETLKYLPFSAGAHGGFRQNIIEPNTGLYICTAGPTYAMNSDNRIADDVRPYAETIFEASPLNRPVKQFGAGKDWGPKDHNKFVRYEYLINVFGDAAGQEKIVAWELDENGVLAKESDNAEYIVGGYYSSNQLSIKVTTDEQGNAVREYTNRSGQIILKKVQVVSGSTDLNNLSEWALTYYVYDDHNNLVIVVPPEAVRILGN